LLEGSQRKSEAYSPSPIQAFAYCQKKTKDHRFEMKISSRYVGRKLLWANKLVSSQKEAQAKAVCNMKRGVVFLRKQIRV
jgi:hypothetical protein